MYKLCGKAQFPHSFEQFTRNYTEITYFQKTSIPENEVKLRHFTQSQSWARFYSLQVCERGLIMVDGTNCQNRANNIDSNNLPVIIKSPITYPVIGNPLINNSFLL